MDQQLDVTLARMRDVAELYRQLAQARHADTDGRRRQSDLGALDQEYADDLVVAAGERRAERVLVRKVEDDLQQVEAKLQDRRSRRPTDATTMAAIVSDIEALRKRRDELEQQLVELWGRDEVHADQQATETQDVQTRRDDIARRRQHEAERVAKAGLAQQDIEDELAGSLGRLPIRVAGRLKRLSTQLVDPVADLIQGTCGGCGQAMPPQDAVDVDRETALAVCQGCGRYIVARSSRKTRG